MGIRQWLAVIIAFFGIGQVACASHGTLIDGQTLQSQTLEGVLRQVPAGSIILVGENHAVPLHRDQQVALMNALRQDGHVVSVGMEFLPYGRQAAVEQYRAGILSEADFLASIQWGKTPFEFYRQQILFPAQSEGATTWALNAPSWLTSKVGKGGLAALTDEDKALLPPQFSLGRLSYRDRFARMMPHLPDPSALDRYFEAQSIWDDTMAWRVTLWRQQYPGQTLVVVVGDFHVQYGGGLPDRIFARLGIRPYTFSQVQLHDLTQEEREKMLANDPVDGKRADWIWTDL